ncbi:uncharacterized protein BJ171DRAFT_453904 [Polychytrium aggregatum]|uniref:uncharacterized protein n=1 Tax=Polychytrium aggregatum TaxID=110093 RepID=UPI0022FE287F|nr:uncharacterized protein BJ171DRAFT_453904 [Polychytrium aggregatum]KAI9209734.1 hypothetical protein BJ171DRAFT_453904 [Polychytrium aggregatum]
MAQNMETPALPPLGPLQIHLTQQPAQMGAGNGGGVGQFGGKDAIHNFIQDIWFQYSSMGDAQRGQLLKGLIARSSTKQLDLISTFVNAHTHTSCPYLWAKSDHEIMATEQRHGRTDRFSSTELGLDGGTHLPSHINANLYIKLLNTNYDCTELTKQSQKAGPDTMRNMLGFLSERCKKLQSLITCMRTISTEQSADKCFGLLLDCALTNTDGRWITLYLLDDSRRKLLPRVSNWNKNAQDALDVDRVFCTTQVLKGEIGNLYNVKGSDLYTNELDETYGKIEVECIVSVPMFSQSNHVVGVLEIINKVSGSPYFGAEDEFVLKSLASMWTLRLDSVRTTHDTIRKVDDMQILLKTASNMSSEMELGDLTITIMNTVKELLGAERCTLFILDREKQELWSAVAQGTAEIRIPHNRGIAGHVVQTGELLSIPDAYSDPRFNRAIDLKTGYRTRNILCVPMKNSSNKIIGVVQIINKLPESSHFTKDDESLILSFSSLAAETLEKSMAFKKMKENLEASRKTNELLEAVALYTPGVVVTIDASGNVIRVNQPDKLDEPIWIPESQPIKYEQFFGEANPQLLVDISRAMLTKNTTVYGQEYEWIVNENVKRINYRINQIVLSGGLGAIVVVEEITESLRIKSIISRQDLSLEWRAVVYLHDGNGYMPPAIVNKLMEDRARLEGIRQKGSVVQINLEDYCVQSDLMSPTTGIAVLNRFYTYMLESLVSEQGILDHYAGESCQALFGLPFGKSDDAVRAVRFAFKVRVFLEEFNLKNVKLGASKLDYGIGITTGTLLAGLIGSTKRQDYSVVGDSCAIAKLLESATKTYGTIILICDRTQDEVREKFHLREVDTISSGKGKPVTVYEVLAPIDIELSHDNMTSLICFELGLAEYRAQKWQGAISHFKKAVQLTDDRPSKLFIERCRAIMEGRCTIPTIWNGVWVLNNHQ